MRIDSIIKYFNCPRLTVPRKKIWRKRFKNHLFSIGLHITTILDNYCTRKVIDTYTDLYMSKFRREWSSTLQRETSIRGKGRNKLKIYRTFKDNYCPELHLQQIMPKSHRSS